MLHRDKIVRAITLLLEQATPEQLRILYQVIRAMLRPGGGQSESEECP